MKETIFAMVSAPVKVTEEQIENLLCSAFEGGSNYWAGIQGYEFPEGKMKDDFKYLHTDVVMAGGKIFLYDRGSDNSNKRYSAERKEEWTLTREKLVKGLTVMANLKKGEGGHHWPNFVQQNDDAETADVYLQCCLFGEIVYS